MAFFEGPILFTVCGFLLRFGTEHFLPLFVALGNVLGDTLWYCLGYFFARRTILKRGSLLGISSDHLISSERIFERYQGRMLFLTKATLGFGTSVGLPAMLTAAGMAKVPFGRYMAFSLAGELVLAGIFMSIGYIYGVSYQTVSKDLRIATLIGFVIVLVLIGLAAKRYLSKERRILEEEAGA